MRAQETKDFAERIRRLADSEMQKADRYFHECTPETCSVFLMEACRVMDLQHVTQLLSANPGHHIPRPEFDTLVRGWNPLLSILLPKIAEADGIPIMESTVEFRLHVRQMLYALGTASTLRHAAEMVEFGMVVAVEAAGKTILRMADRVSLDHFLDALEPSKLHDVLGGEDEAKAAEFDPDKVTGIRDLMKPLVFPWDTGHGLMVGYNADEDVDDFFIESALRTVDR